MTSTDAIDPFDPDRAVAHQAHQAHPPATDPARLRDFLAARPPVEAAVWALCALHGLTGDAEETAERYARLGRPRVELPGLPEPLRRAIVHEYAARSERGTDPRWRIEAICAEPSAPVDVDGQLRRVAEVLGSAGIAAESPIAAAEDYGTGDGTFHLIRFGEYDTLFVSTLGPFVRGMDDSPVRAALERAGFHWVDEDTANLVVTDLCVHYFGEREPLSVDTLLFCWQD